MVAHLFPGQGSQHRGMGGALFDTVEQFVAAESEIDALFGYSVRDMCRDDPGEKLKNTRYTQPCLYVVNALHYYDEIRNGHIPKYLAGHSLGEYNALLAAGVFDFLTGLRLVIKRGELMAKAKNGGMAAVVGLDSAQVAQVIADKGFSKLDVANFNSPQQVVISGPVKEIARTEAAFVEAGASMFVPLPVSAAFHSRYMRDAAAAFEAFLEPMSFAAPAIPVIANATARPYPVNDASGAVKTLLVRQISQSVQWVQGLQFLLAQGETEFKEIGPGTVLTRLVDQTRRATS